MARNLLLFFLVLRVVPSCVDHQAKASGLTPQSCSTNTMVEEKSKVIGDRFIAFPPDFQDFETWKSFELSHDDTSQNGHFTGTRTVYINQEQDSSAKEFAVGTIIVKVIKNDEVDPIKWEIHARAKRGLPFNQQGALGWEWFELRFDHCRRPGIVWRGIEPPQGEGYESFSEARVTGDCNACHVAAKDNDFVQSSALKLALPN